MALSTVVFMSRRTSALSLPVIRGAIVCRRGSTFATADTMIRKPTGALLIISGIAVAAVTATLSMKRVVTAAALQVDPAPASPARIGTQAAGSFADATGHSGQSHLVYAANSGVWWLFMTSSADSPGGANHVVKAYRSSGPDLATAAWNAATDSPGASVSAGFAPNGFMGGGRALGVVYVNNAPADIVHAEVAIAADGQDGITGHIRARLTATGITWESWNYKVEGAATWTLPRAATLGLSNGKIIHSGGPTLQQEVDANARRSTNADTGATWASGFSSVVVIDNSMLHQCNALAFAPLAGDTMLAVYDNGRGTEPGQTNLRFKRSNTNGTWTGVVVGSQLGGDGDVFGTTASIDQNDWALVPLSTTTIRAYRRNATGTGIDASAYNAASNTWSAASAPPPFGAGQAFKSGGGLFGAHDATSTWLFVINTDAANTILYTKHDGTSWSPWSPVPGTNSGTHTRRFISGQPVFSAGQIGLVWTEGSTAFDIFATGLATLADTAPPAVSLLAPADGSTVFGSVSISASAWDDRAVAGVQFQLDGANLGARQTTPRFGMTWDSRTVANGTHSIAAIATDGAGNASSAFAAVSVANRPVIAAVSATSLSTTSESIAWTTDVAATSVVDSSAKRQPNGGSVSDPALVTSHRATLSGLTPGTTYHYQVTSADASGNLSSAGDFTFATPVPDTTLPTVSLTAPADGAIVSGAAVTVSASAADNVAVAGVQFTLDGVNLGAEDTTSPYSVAWNTTTATNAIHSLTAVARDAAGRARRLPGRTPERSGAAAARSSRPRPSPGRRRRAGSRSTSRRRSQSPRMRST
jgi:Big-like domain-containing protein